jgi:hypothetical protein
MKMILIVLTMMFMNTALAKNDYLVCLGAEEAYIHKKKIGGAYKKLNQSILNELIMFSENIVMDAKVQKKICARNDNFPSIEILRSILLGHKIFSSKIKNSAQREYAIDITTIDSFRTQSKFVFINFLTNLLTEVKDPKCLIKEFPELKDFFLRMEHVLLNVGIQKLVSEIENKEKFFQKLKTPSWKVNCQE